MGTISLPNLYRWALLHRFRVLAAAALLVLLAAPGALRLTLRTDGRALVSTSAPEVQFDQKVRDEFGVEDPIAIVVRSAHPDGIYNPHTLTLIRDLTGEVSKLDGLSPASVSSIATERSDRVVPGTLEFTRFLEPVPSTPEEIATFRGDIDAVRLFSGTLISSDTKAATILVSIPEGRDRIELYRTLRALIAARGALPEDIHVLGAPVAEALLGHHILDDLGVPAALTGAHLERSPGVSSGPEALRGIVARRLGLVPAALLITSLVLLVAFRSLTATALALLKLGASLLLVFGLMGWLGVPIYLTTAVMPVMLVATGISDEIHIFTRYARELRERPERGASAALSITLDELWEPVAKTSLTTAVGFLSFAISPLSAVRAFGIFTGIGTLFCFLWALTVTPVCVSLLDPARFTSRAPRSGSAPARWVRLGALVTLRPRAILAVAALALVASGIGATRITVQDSWLDGFSPESEMFRATRGFNEQFLGAHMLLVRVSAAAPPLAGSIVESNVDHHELWLPATAGLDATALDGRRVTLRRANKTWTSSVTQAVVGDGRLKISFSRGASPRFALSLAPGAQVSYEIAPQPLVSPEALERIAELEAFIAARHDLTVGGVLGPAGYLATTRFLVEGRRPGARSLPQRSRHAEDLWSSYQQVRGPERLRQVVGKDYGSGLVTVFLKDANYVSTQRLMEEIRTFEHTRLSPIGLTLGFAGDVAVSQALIAGIVSTQIVSLVLSLVGVLAVTAWMGRSLSVGFASLVPCTFAVLVSFGTMGWLGTPLGVATSMFASMSVGIGIDYAIHLLDRLKLVLAAGREPNAALVEALTSTAPAIFTDAMAVSLGFGVLVLSQVPANARLGGRVFVTILGCVAATLVLLPALLSLWRPSSLMRPTHSRQ